MNISKDQFYLQTERLVNAFGERSFPEQRTLMIWESVSGLEYGTVIKIVDRFIRESKTAPLPVNFFEAVKAESGAGPKRYALGEIKPKELAQCLDCGDSGFIRLERKDEFEEWAKWQIGSAPCACYRGRELVESGRKHNFGPRFNEEWKKSYKIISVY